MNIESLSQLKKTPKGTTHIKKCQKCLEPGHWTFECKGQSSYVSRPSRTQMLQKPLVLKRERLEKLEDPIGLADKILAQKSFERKGKDESPKESRERSRSRSRDSKANTSKRSSSRSP